MITRKEYLHNYYIKNKDILKIDMKEYNIKNKIRIKDRRHYYYLENKERIKVAIKKYRIKNLDKIRLSSRSKLKHKYNNNPIYKLKMNLEANVRNSLRNKNRKKLNKTNKLLGCTYQEFYKYIEQKFKLGMNWQNAGLYGWHLDHIRPVSSFDLKNLEEQQKCNHYTNFQPLWAKENLKKGNKFVELDKI